MPNHIVEDVAIFWDYGEQPLEIRSPPDRSSHHSVENCHSASNISGYEIVNAIRRVAHTFGSVKYFKAYMEFIEPPTPRSLSLRSELQSSGVSLTDCPHNGRKNVADKMIIGLFI